jgi:hypothetical protein
MNNDGKVWVVFADSYDASEMSEDMICRSQEEAARHSHELLRLDCSPVVRSYKSETEFYAKQEKKRGY